jgi:hypothetical protein
MGHRKSGIIFVLVLAMVFNVSVATGEVLCISGDRIAIEREHESAPVDSETPYVCPCSAHGAPTPASDSDDSGDCGNCQDIPLMTGSVWATANLEIPDVDVDFTELSDHFVPVSAIQTRTVPAHLTFDRRTSFSERSCPLRC